jgi:hypothetical protein
MMKERRNKLRRGKSGYSCCAGIHISIGYKSAVIQKGAFNHAILALKYYVRNCSSFLSRRFSNLLMLVIIYSLLVTILVPSASAQASLTSVPTQTDRAPSFLEAYWTEDTISSPTSPTNNSKKEIGPGEGTSTLAVVLVNRGRTDIVGVIGHLTLPPGFRAIEGENNVTSPNVAVASHESIVEAGESFTLYFTMDVLPQANVGAYVSELTLSYSKILEVGQISTSMLIPFRVTGKVILDTTLVNQNLTAGYLNPLQILITNYGTANATGAVVTVTGVSSGTTVTNGTSGNTSSNRTSTAVTTTAVDSETFNIGNIPAGSSVVITPLVYPDYSSGGTIQTLDLEIAYNDAYGIRTNSIYSIGMIVAPNPPESVLSISPGLVATVSSSGQGTPSRVQTNGDSIELTAGRIETLSFNVTNNGSSPLTDIVFSISSGTNSVKILGDSRWRVDYMAPSETYIMSTTVYAAEDVINTPIEFEINAEYIERGQSKTDTLSIGAYVDGQIRIRAYDLDINYIGGAPNLVGNLLNEGNTVGLFTTIELANSATQSSLNDSLVTGTSQQQYLGDLSENSPLPFSIPLDFASDLPAGSYPVTLNVTYSDNLRAVHELLLNDTVVYEGTLSTSNSNESNSEAFSLINEFSSFFPILIIIIVGGLVGLFLIRRRKKKRSGNVAGQRVASTTHESDSNTFRQQQIDSDTDSLFDDESLEKKNKP